MDWGSATPLAAIKQRLDWLGQRQQVLARNIANADTPGYRPRDLEEVRFDSFARRPAAALTLATTEGAHLPGTPRPHLQFAEEVQRDTADATPSGNAVDLEEQMAKVSETAASHKFATQLYRKYMGLVRLAASARG
jgi:flagellar basal-body rod protein FlgB